MTAKANELQVVDEEQAKRLQVSHQKFRRLVERHGQEAVAAVSDLKDAGINLHLGRFFAVVARSRLRPAEVAELYLVRQEFFTLEGNCPVTIKGLVALAETFPGFCETEVEAKVEQIEKALEMIYPSAENRYINFREAVETILRRAKDLGFDSLESLIEAIQAQADGDLYQTYFRGLLDSDPHRRDDE